jgi:hypothetical protein
MLPLTGQKSHHETEQMPLDNSNSQSFRTHRLRCKAIAGGRVQNAAMPLSNEQTVPDSTFVDFKLGRMPYLVQPSSGGPVTTNAGCCSSGVAPVDCNVCSGMLGILTTLLQYDNLRTNLTSGTLPDHPVGYDGLVIILSAQSCGQNYTIDSLLIPQPLGPPITRNPSGYTTNRECVVFPNPPTNKQDFIIIFDSSITYPSLVLDVDVTINGTIQPCGVPIISNPVSP